MQIQFDQLADSMIHVVTWRYNLKEKSTHDLKQHNEE